MRKFTLLLDLDDTLLDTNMQEFIPAYFSALAAALADYVQPEVMLPALTKGTKAMMQNRDPGITLRQVFDSHFFPMLGMEREYLQVKIDDFYENRFPELAHVTHQRSEAIDFVNWAFREGHRVAIATNPYFPLRAIQHRLRWAGLASEEYYFALVSSYESFHFTKESPAYFLEFLGQMGWPEDPVVMVGNDVEMDLIPAQKAGLPVFWLTHEIGTGQFGFPAGTFAELKKWLNQSDPDDLTAKIETPESIIAMLSSTPAALDTLTRDISAEGWKCHPEEDEWCLTEIFCHLRDVEADINLPRIKKISSEPNPFLVGVVSDDWVQERDYASQDGRVAMQQFLEIRKQTLAILQKKDILWHSTARHAIFGPTTLQELMGIAAGHDRAHIQQVWKTIKR